MLSRLRKIPIQHPFAFGILISTTKTSLCDILVQKVVEKRDAVDWRRNAAFSSFGFFYLGGVQYGLYVKVFGRLFPNAAGYAAKSLAEKVKDARGTADVVKQVFLDQFVHHPLAYFPVFYCTKEAVMGSGEGGTSDFVGCLRTYRENMWEDLQALWKIWVPSTLINFAFMPMWGRIPWVAATSGIWTCILSAMRGGSISDAEEMVGGAVTGATMKIFKRTWSDFFTCPLDMDGSKSHICISASGPNKSSLLALLAREVALNGGNVTHSKMMRMGSEFVILMHVSVEPSLRKKLVTNLLASEDLEPLNVRTSTLTRRMTGFYDPAVLGFRVHCVGHSDPYMLASISQTIGGMGLNIENVSTEIRRRKDGKVNNVITIDCCTSENWSDEHRHEMVKELKMLQKDLSLETMDIKLHVLTLEQ